MLETKKTAIVTGDSRGVGKDMAHSRARHGINGVCFARDAATPGSLFASIAAAKMAA